MGNESSKPAAGRGRWRCFWAALPEAESERRLAAVVSRLRAAEGGGLRWIPRANWHLTLHFLGSIGESRIAALRAALESRPLPAPLSLTLRGIGPFPSARPRTLAALLDSAPALTQWVRYLRALEPEAARDAENSDYLAHLTVARPRPRRRVRYPELELATELLFDRIALLRSDTRPSGAVYTPLAIQAAE